MNLHTRLKQLREDRGLNQQELATHLNVDNSQISRYESGKLEPNIGMLIEIADYFECSIDFLLGHNVKIVGDRDDGLTEAEGVIMDGIAHIWNKFSKLEKHHPAETNDFVDGIHKCQYVLGMRVLRRNYPKGYPLK
jgi:transcriptional regulator with XRE-family HTH domain